MHHDGLTVSHGHAIFTEMLKNIWQQKNGKSLNSAIKYSLFSAWKVNYSKNINTDSILMQFMTEIVCNNAQITELTKNDDHFVHHRMNNN